MLQNQFTSPLGLRIWDLSTAWSRSLERIQVPTRPSLGPLHAVSCWIRWVCLQSATPIRGPHHTLLHVGVLRGHDLRFILGLLSYWGSVLLILAHFNGLAVTANVRVASGFEFARVDYAHSEHLVALRMVWLLNVGV